MNEMYSMGLSIHSIGAVVLLGTIFLNIVVLRLAKDIKKYKRVMSIFLIPLSITSIGLAVFPGVIMMAAKHLDFTIENIVMIVISIAIIVLEARRAKYLTFMRDDRERVLEAYSMFAFKILYIEVGLVGVISVWMWLI
ncbi:MAG: hypothetical protein GXO30_08905 [Epsilonproteobacteria bacterium]|nr:hypothetical protein [Campylobacterota bacterium]